MTQILDYSAGYPGAAAVERAGYSGVIRYLRKEGVSAVKPVTAAEYADMRARGRSVALVYQHVARDRATAGHAAGVHDAQWARARAFDLGAGEPRAIYFAVDFDAVPSALTGYFAGCGEVLGAARVGVYGSYRVVHDLHQGGLVAWMWQTAAWSHGSRLAGAHLYQRIGQVTVGGVSCDVNDAQSDHGQYQEDDMTPYELGALERASYRINAVMNLYPSLDEPLSEKNPDGSAARLQEPVRITQRFVALEEAIVGLGAKVDRISTAGIDYAQLARAINDDADARRRDGDPTTGPVS